MRSLGINRTNRNGVRIGYWESYWGNGNLHSEGSYVNGLREGLWKSYWENGNLQSKGLYVNNEQDGLWEYYKQDGELDFIKNYREGVEI